MKNLDREADTFRRIEVITGVGRRRRWSDEVRAGIVAETLEQGARVSDVARRHGVAPSQVFAWRKAARQQSLALPVERAIFAPVVASDDRAQGQLLLAQRPLLMIEVETGEAKLRIPAGAPREAILAVMEGLGALKRRR
jgi:transposase